MKIAYYSSIFFTDCDFPLIRQYQTKGESILYIIEVVANRLKGGLFNIKGDVPCHGIIPVGKIPEFQVYKDYIDLNNVFLYVRTNNLYNPINWLFHIILCCKILKFKASIVHVTQALGISECLLYFFRKKMVLTVHDPFPHSGENSMSFEIKRKIAFRLVNRIVLLNEKQRNDFVLHYHLMGKVCVSKLSIYECLRLLAGKHSANQYGRYILFFGHFSPYKGIDVLCKAMKIISQSDPNVICVIAGKGELDFDFKEYDNIKQIVLLNHFIELEDLASLIRNCLFVVCPYKDATQSGVVFSAFALSKPVLATNVGGLSESVIDNFTGKIVQPNNADELAECIIQMCNENDKIVRMAENIKNKYQEGIHSWSKIADEYINIYKKIIPNR